MHKLLKHQTDPKSKPKRVIKVPEIDKANPLGYFDGASQGEPSLGGAGGILYLNET